MLLLLLAVVQWRWMMFHMLERRQKSRASRCICCRVVLACPFIAGALPQHREFEVCATTEDHQGYVACC